MTASFLKIGITPEPYPSDIAEEISIICNLLDSDQVDIFHLRHPGSTDSQMREYLSMIPELYLSKITLHDHFSLIEDFNVGGINLNSRNPILPVEILNKTFGRNIRLSRSCHSIGEIDQVLRDNKDIEFKYLTLSPIFNSISKIGYKSNFNLNNLKAIIPSLPVDVVALGGVSPDSFPLLKSIGFKGGAMLGYFFK